MIQQNLSANDIKEGLIRVSQANLAFFGVHHDEWHFTLPDGSCHTVSLTCSQTGNPRFFQALRKPLKNYFKAVGAKATDQLHITCESGNHFKVTYWKNSLKSS